MIINREKRNISGMLLNSGVARNLYWRLHPSSPTFPSSRLEAGDSGVLPRIIQVYRFVK